MRLTIMRESATGDWLVRDISTGENVLRITRDLLQRIMLDAHTAEIQEVTQHFKPLDSKLKEVLQSGSDS